MNEGQNYLESDEYFICEHVCKRLAATVLIDEEASVIAKVIQAEREYWFEKYNLKLLSKLES